MKFKYTTQGIITISYISLIHFQPIFYFYASENKKKHLVSDVFRGYNSGTMVENGLIISYIQNSLVHIANYDCFICGFTLTLT